MTTASNELNSAKMEKITEQILDKVKRNPGTSVNAIAHDTGLSYKVVSNICTSLLNSKQLYREVNGNHHRYYLGSVDRRDIKTDNSPTTRGKPKKDILKDDGKRPEFSPSPDSMIGKSINEQKAIPADLKTYTPIEETVVPEPEHVEEEHKEIENIDIMLDQLKALKLIQMGSSADISIKHVIDEIENSLSKCVSFCPFCGNTDTRINVSPSQEYSIRCSCGAIFAYQKNTKNLGETVKAWNTRA